MRIAIGSDHASFYFKEMMEKYLKEDLKHDCTDMGTHNTERCDYVDYAFLVAEAVANGRADFGMVFDGAGVASAIVANKVPGIRAAVCNEIFTAVMSREHNDANVMTMGSNVVGEGLAKEIVKTWLSRQVSGERNLKRIQKIRDLEKRLYSGV